MSFKKVFLTSILVVIGLSTNYVFSQLGGVSSNFLASYNALPVPKNVLELEPTFSYSRSLGFFDTERNYQNITGVNIASSLYFRATYGISDNLEVGAGLATNLNILNLGAKLHVLGNEKFGLAVMGGINSNITNGARLLSSLERQYIIGLASHYLYNEELSLNASIQYQDVRDYEGSDLIFNVEAGYYINENVLGITGIGICNYSNSDLADSMLFSLYPGLAIERTNIIIVIQGQLDLFGENNPSTNGISVSLTQLIQ